MISMIHFFDKLFGFTYFPKIGILDGYWYTEEVKCPDQTMNLYGRTLVIFCKIYDKMYPERSKSRS